MGNVRLLHEALTVSAERDPEAVAVVDGDRSLTYGQLDERSSQLSQLLADCGVRRGDRVGVHAQKSLESVVALYGAMKSGAAYVPLDPTVPPSRTAHIANDCDIGVLLSPTALASRWAGLAEAGAKIEHLVALDATAGRAGWPATSSPPWSSTPDGAGVEARSRLPASHWRSRALQSPLKGKSPSTNRSMATGESGT